MTKRWWDGLSLGRPGKPSEPVASEREHLERCPFCGTLYDMRDLGQVFEHYDHQLAAGVPPAKDLTTEEDRES